MHLLVYELYRYQDARYNDKKKLKMVSSQKHLILKKWNCVFPEDGTNVSKHTGEANLVLVLINNVHLVGKMNGVQPYALPVRLFDR